MVKASKKRKIINGATVEEKCTKYRYSYGRKWTLENMKDTKVKLPATHEGKPDWKFMEGYIKSLAYGNKLQ